MATDEFLKKRYTVTDETGKTAVDGQGLQFAKAVALAQARRNGGDTTAALGFAFDIDNRIRAEAGGDVEKVRTMRAELLQRAGQAQGPQQTPASVPASASPPAPVSAAPTPMPRMAAAPPKEPAPAGSPQAQWDARQATVRQQQAQQEAAQAAAVLRAQQQFELDARTLGPLDLLRKYQDFAARAALGREQLLRLKAAETQIR